MLDDLVTYATIIASFATVGALIFVGYETMMLRSEKIQTFRAWVSQGESHVFFHGHFDENKNFIPMEKWKKMTLEERAAIIIKYTRRYIEIKNFGQLPANKLKARTKFIVSQEPTRKDIESESFLSSSTLMPNGTIKLFIITSREEEKAIEDPEKNCYLIWEVEYESPKGKKRKYGEISSVSQHQYGTINTWDEKN